MLAATRLIALHKNKGKSVAACLKSRTDYAKNPDKTNMDLSVGVLGQHLLHILNGSGSTFFLIDFFAQ